jgi:hypothetical protein
MDVRNVEAMSQPAIRALWRCCGDCSGKELDMPVCTPAAAKFLSDGTVRYRHAGQHRRSVSLLLPMRCREHRPRDRFSSLASDPVRPNTVRGYAIT